MKIELISELLKSHRHDVEILAQGEVDRNEFKFYPRLREKELSHPEVPIFYASALPIRFLCGFWASWRMISLFKERHRIRPFDAIIIYNMKRGHLACARYGHRLGLPVVLEYEDDVFVDVRGVKWGGLLSRLHSRTYSDMLRKLSGCLAVSPYLLSQCPESIPKLLVRGVVNKYIVQFSGDPAVPRRNRAVFSGTLENSQGLEQLVSAWRRLKLKDWELHIAGIGPIEEALRKLAQNDSTIVFHGFLGREENARLLCSARLGLNPQDVTRIPGTSFAFKIIEYLAAGLHVISTPRGSLEAELQAGMTYLGDNSAETIAATIQEVLSTGKHQNTAREATLQIYGADALAGTLGRFFDEVMKAKQLSTGEHQARPSTVATSALAR